MPVRDGCHKTVIYDDRQVDILDNSTPTIIKAVGFARVMKMARKDFSRNSSMCRVLVFSAALAALMSVGTSAALAQSPSAKLKSPGQIAAASRLLAEKNESCRQQAREQGLRFLKRRRFIRDCVKAGQ
jgi:7-keto-8-aminopelargonate synthetase-like enzyme